MATPLTVHTDSTPMVGPAQSAPPPGKLETVVAAGLVLGTFLGLGVAYVATYGVDDAPPAITIESPVPILSELLELAHGISYVP